jgi:hypothetical protein
MHAPPNRTLAGNNAEGLSRFPVFGYLLCVCAFAHPTIEDESMKSIVSLSIFALAYGMVACGGSTPEPTEPAHEVAEERAENAEAATDANTEKAEDAAAKAEDNAAESADSAAKAEKAADETKK